MGTLWIIAAAIVAYGIVSMVAAYWGPNDLPDVWPFNRSKGR